MNKTQRVVFFGILLTALFTIDYFCNAKVFPTDNVRIVIYSCLAMMALIVMFLEHFFTRPTDVLAASVSIILLVLPVKTDLVRFGVIYELFLGYCFFVAFLALVSLVLLTSRENDDSKKNRISNWLKVNVIRIGAGKVQFAILFYLTIFYYLDKASAEFLLLFSLCFVIVIIDPSRIKISFSPAANIQNSIGEVFGVQSRNVFLCRLYEDSSLPNLLAPVTFVYDNGNIYRQERGIVLDRYMLNQEQWVRILTTEELVINNVNAEDSATRKVYSSTDTEINSAFQNFVGIVTEQSRIEKIRFYYPSQAIEITDGQLLVVTCRNQQVLYQIVQASTERETLEFKDQAGYIIGEAVQIGVWNPAESIFEKFGWVPEINTPLFLATNVPTAAIESSEMQIGTIPGTSYPIILDKEIAITHHLAILGVTGSGKSVFARNLMRQYLSDGVKVIAIDFTGEYSNKFQSIRNIIEDSQKTSLFSNLEFISNELDKYANQRDNQGIKTRENQIQTIFHASIKNHFESEDNHLAIFELPEISNSTLIFDYTKWFFKVLFEIARKEANFGKRVCIVLEEAHTIIPEWNFAGSTDKRAQAIVNSISQIALQGRKYNIGLMVIAQRTANVSKTVLTQCNSIIAFQVFDNTSADFLSNYIGSDLAKILGYLKQKQAIATGKCFRTNVPLIFQVPEISE